MHIPLLSRLTILTLNILFPPLAVAMITGPLSRDTMLNCVLFLLAVIPAHIHGFYISAVYFTRKRRVRNGKWPGGPKGGIWSERVLTGGLGGREAERLRVSEGVQDKGGVKSKGQKSRGSSKRGNESPVVSAAVAGGGEAGLRTEGKRSWWKMDKARKGKTAGSAVVSAPMAEQETGTTRGVSSVAGPVSQGQGTSRRFF